MPSFKGFVQTLQVRDDSWVEFTCLAPHAGNATQSFLIRALDGDIDAAHRRLGQLGLLRDAVARVLPVEVDYDNDDHLGRLVRDLTIHPRPTLEGRDGLRSVEGVVIGIAVADIDPQSSASPYLDPADLAGITILTDTGGLEVGLIDLQRPDALTGHGMLRLCAEARRSRRPIRARIATGRRDDDRTHARTDHHKAPPGIVTSVQWLQPEEASLDEVYAFVERLEQRSESWEPGDGAVYSHLRVTYTTAPGQTPAGDISDNGAFLPQRREAVVHADSPLVALLEAALRDSLQVRLGLLEQEIHEVLLVSKLGSAARPIWIEVTRNAQPAPPGLCDNVPTIGSPDSDDLDQVPVSLAWRGLAYFVEGIWRFRVASEAEATLRIDGERPCGGATAPDDDGRARPSLYHAYANGLHRIEVTVTGRHCDQPFSLEVYRLR